MVLQRYRLFFTALLVLALPVFASAGPKASTTKKHHHRKAAVAHKLRLTHASRHHSLLPAEMPAARATQIQTALIQQGYMTGTPTGTWDAQTVSAMQKLQGENGWQTKITPDSRALIKLGLGPHPSSDVADQAQGTAPIASH